jgi:hypothetical protein
MVNENQLLPSEVINKILQEEVKNTKIQITKNSTGVSYFQGRKRLVKVLFTKKGISLEINVILPAPIVKQFNLQEIPYQIAKQKHLGTMKYHFKQEMVMEEKIYKLLIKSIIKQFLQEMEIEENKNTSTN